MAREMTFNEAASLRVQVIRGERGIESFSISAEPNKGAPDEEVAIQTIEELSQALRAFGVSPRECTRRTPQGQRADRLIIE